MIVFLDIILVFCAIGMAVTYLYFIYYIRTNSEQDSMVVNNYFIFNVLKVYKCYLYVRKKNSLKNGIVIYLHFIFIVATLVIGYFLDGFGATP